MDFLGLRNLDVIEAALHADREEPGRLRRHDHAAARRRQDLRDAAPAATRRASSSSRAAACRRRCARSARPVRGPHRHRAPSTGRGPCSTSRPTPATRRTRRSVVYDHEAPAAHPRADPRRDHLPGAVHGHRPPRGRLHAGPGRRPAQGHRQEGQEAHGEPQGAAHGRPARRAACRRHVCTKLWSNFEATGDYSFNKSHAACYALISYRTAFLKANYPVEYMAALVSSVMNTKDKVPFYVNQCHEMGIEVLPPDVNESEVGFTVVERQDPLRAERRQGGRATGPSSRSSRPAATARSPRSTTSAPASTPPSSTSARSRR